MDKKIQKVLTTLHEFFKDDDKKYIEYENSDMEYFVGCMLYNHFDFKNALDTMKTMDLSYDFLVACGDIYDEVQTLINEISLEKEDEKLIFLQNYIREVKSKYTFDELYLLNRFEYHINGVKQRYDGTQQAQKVDFAKPKIRSKNPLLR